MCVGPKRINEAMVTLSFDYNLITKPSKTLIVSPYTVQEFRSLFIQFGIDYDNITIIPDQYFSQYYDLTAWSKDNWYKQQAFKLCALDQFDSDYFLIQDCDIALIKPYNMFIEEKINFKAEPLWNPYQHIYGKMISKILGIPRTLQISLVNELMPVIKKDWQALKQLLETRHKTDFLTAISKVRPFDDTKWFSEYELLGMFKMFKDNNWTHFITVSQPPINTWDDFYDANWTNQDTVKFHAQPLKFMSIDEAHRVVEFLKNVN
jgi:hypothetical protein